MRLRQLARKLGVHPDKILTLLADSGHELENEANSKLTEEQVQIAETHFPPPVIEKVEEEITASPAIETVAVSEPEEAAPIEAETTTAKETPEIEETSEVEVTEENEPDLEHLEVPFGPPSHATSQVSDNTQAEPEKPKKVAIQLENPKPEVKVYNAIEEDEEFLNAELIKTEKPVLEGLKVVGKIDLPEPKKPEPKAEEETENKETENKPEKKHQQRRNGRNDRGRGRNRKNQRQRLSPLEYERQKAERLAKKKKKEAEKKLKQKKEEHYKAKMEAKSKGKKKTAPAKLKKKAPREEEAIAPLPINGMSRPKPTVKKEKKKGPLKRFWGWLNGESDNF